jgi:hypothetical protein
LQELDLRIAFEGKSSGLADTQLRAVIQLLKMVSWNNAFIYPPDRTG